MVVWATRTLVEAAKSFLKLVLACPLQTALEQHTRAGRKDVIPVAWKGGKMQ